MARQAGFFEMEKPLRELSAKSDDLERIAVLLFGERFPGAMACYQIP